MDNDLAIRALHQCRTYAARSTCNIRNVGAALFLDDGLVYMATNGTQQDACTLKGKEHCTRDTSIGGLEYLTCPSPCAEGTAIIAALLDDKKVSGSSIVSTDFPCNRCKDILIDYGVKELYFSATGYTKGEPRLRDLFFAAQMVANGIVVHEIFQASRAGKTEYAVQPFIPDEALQRLAERAMRNNGEFYVRQILDSAFRAEMARFFEVIKTQHMQQLLSPASVIVAQPLL